MFKPKNETEDFLLSININCEMLITQTYRIPEETIEFKMDKLKETFHFKPSIPLEVSWMIGLTYLEEYNSTFKRTEENNNFKLYLFPESKIGGISYEKVRDEIENDLDISDITATDLQDEIIGSFMVVEYKEQVQKEGKMKNFAYFSKL